MYSFLVCVTQYWPNLLCNYIVYFLNAQFQYYQQLSNTWCAEFRSVGKDDVLFVPLCNEIFIQFLPKLHSFCVEPSKPAKLNSILRSLKLSNFPKLCILGSFLLVRLTWKPSVLCIFFHRHHNGFHDYRGSGVFSYCSSIGTNCVTASLSLWNPKVAR